MVGSMRNAGIQLGYRGWRMVGSIQARGTDVATASRLLRLPTGISGIWILDY